MRTCLLIVGALTLVTTAAAAVSAPTSYSSLPDVAPTNHEVALSAFSTLVRRSVNQHGERTCVLLDRNVAQIPRTLHAASNAAKESLRSRAYEMTVRQRQDPGIHDGRVETEKLAADEILEFVGVVPASDNDEKEYLQGEQEMLSKECNVVPWAGVPHKLSIKESYGADSPGKLRLDSHDPFGSLASDEHQFNMDDPRQVDGEPQDEVRQLVHSGHPKNRIDMVLMGDGYTASEREKFFGDMQRLVDVYKESRESGIGVNGRWKDTAFKLYRDGTELRGVYTADPRAARKACKLTGPYACDFPSLIANDPYYGGLGGEFVISTSSNKSGTVVLRHEMFHSMGEAGEEYDGGQVYSGVNAERWSWSNPKWKHWLTDAEPREEQNVIRAQDYAWYNLANGPYKVKFDSDGQWQRWSLKISHSGVDQDDSMEVYLDGERLDWKSPGGMDRDFSEWFGDKGFSAGPHELEFRQGRAYDGRTPDEEKDRPIRQLCSVTLHEFAGEDRYRFDNSVISAYPTYDIRKRRTWRPSNEQCLMRNMTSVHLCSVCQEGLWLKLLNKMSLLDDVRVKCEKDELDSYTFNIKADLVPLGQFRENQSNRGRDERYEVRWYLNSTHQPEYDDKISLTNVKEGLWEIRAEFKTLEVRKDPQGLLKASKFFSVSRINCE
ncbi:hypothetical protein DFQ27_006587 [Actinomortierella ambigua]|uniref:IgA peptidase M64-domain-containing protein n=1 Tax=Actinomortierella ambigua TaxID=1343610 RepID=A0A9P6PX30_9FUNG|nr:hypothetical protein DFQ27_006587 [Actinomortierella ambigua]